MGEKEKHTRKATLSRAFHPHSTPIMGGNNCTIFPSQKGSTEIEEFRLGILTYEL
jgi:hypothetical protein